MSTADDIRALKGASAEAIQWALKFAALISLMQRAPEVSVDSDDECVELEWYERPDKIITLSIRPDGQFHFAGINEGESCHGAGRIDTVIPKPG